MTIRSTARSIRGSLNRRLAGPEVSQRKLARYGRTAHFGPLEPTVPSTLAIVVACYGHATYVETMFESVINQSRRPDEVIFVDDHSPDGSGQLMARLVEARPVLERSRMRLLTNDQTLGQAAGINRGVEATESDLIMVLNADDYLMHDVVATMLDLFARHPELALVGATSVHFEDDQELTKADKEIASRAPDGAIPLTIYAPADARRYRKANDLNMTHSGSCFRRVAWLSVGGYNPRPDERVVSFDDRDFQMRVSWLYPVGVSELVPFAFWRRGTSVRRSRDDVGEQREGGFPPSGDCPAS